jgi:hypothetical protein
VTNLATSLVANNDVLMRFAMQAAGFNPDIMTPASKIAAAKLGAMVQARRAAFGASDPSNRRWRPAARHCQLRQGVHDSRCQLLRQRPQLRTGHSWQPGLQQ